MTISLSIVIPSASRPDLLRVCLKSVLKYAPRGTEVVVVDDGSPAGRVSRVANEFAGVTSLRFSTRRGFCIAANAGLKAATNRIVELLNDDTEVTPGWAEPAVAAFDDPTVAAVAPLTLIGPQHSGRPRIDSAGDAYDRGGFARKCGHNIFLSNDYLISKEVFGASGCSAFLRRDLILRLGAFPSHFRAYFEDVDLAHRIHRAGYRVLYVPESRVWHQVGSSHGKPNRQLLSQQSRNEERVFWRNPSDRPLARLIPRHVAVLCAKTVRRWSEGLLLPWLMGRLAAFFEIPSMLRHRCGTSQT